MKADPASQPIWLVTNPASGSNSPASVAAICAALRPMRTLEFPNQPLPTRAELEAAEVATLAVFTGDGTINAAAAALEGWGGALLALPGGTQNLLSKALHGDRTLDAILADVSQGRRVRRRGIRTSQGLSLVEVLVGPGAMWADVRESLRALDFAAMAETFASALRETREGPAVRLVDPPEGQPEGYRALLLAPEGDGVLVEGYDFADIGEFAAQGFAMLIKRNFREGPHDDIGVFPAVTISSAADLALMIDGERRQGGGKERFTCEEIALDFLATHFLASHPVAT
ncbi:diacylglycerol kinase family protein [Novosphingobium sp.]|uniref:diacylglycerol kinase family protein n=1 Tax=Novosphingobium sp. TaxID=1874826 RepID=UPI002605614A|nr:diacylglycerol kinase family protein [Novosphingobium sp.]